MRRQRPARTPDARDRPAAARLAPPPAFRYRVATRVDTLGGNAAEGRRPARPTTDIRETQSDFRFSHEVMRSEGGFRRLRRAAPQTLHNTRKEMP